MQIFYLKRLFAIGLLFIYLFNLTGYFIYYKYSIYWSDKKVITQLDNRQYNEAELIEIKIPLNLPYLTSQSYYERVDGELQHKGVYYNYVERKVHNDTLYLKCHPNNKKTDLHRDLAEYTKKVNDIPSNDKNGTSQKKLSFGIEYVQSLLTFSISLPTNLSTQYSNTVRSLIPCSYTSDSFKPPRLLS